ncbi:MULTISPECIES: hypothetical protein [Burkholderia]|uniref:hypothetical protein n=1 Tax=Burkholderia TaxID=32008 RepID=UPI00054D6EBF|nr:MULTISPECIES: hypothetical protein [Burkholderia]MDN7669515.1 hypothetical protein [Burkholderia vietnamiensis]
MQIARPGTRINADDFMHRERRVAPLDLKAPADFNIQFRLHTWCRRSCPARSYDSTAYGAAGVDVAISS